MEIQLDLAASLVTSLSAELNRLGIGESQLPALLASYLTGASLDQDPTALLGCHVFPHAEAAEHAATRFFQSYPGQDTVLLRHVAESGEIVEGCFENESWREWHAAGEFLRSLETGNGGANDS